MPLFRINGRSVFFAHVPKTGGTSVEATLARVGDVGLHRNRFGGAIPPQHWHAEVYSELVPPAFYDYGFIVVRHPLARVVSEYRVRAMRALRGRTPIPFSLWVEQTFAAYQDDHAILANHIRPQAEFTSPHLNVFHYEDGLQKPVDAVLEFAGATKRPIVARKNSSPDLEVALSAEAIDAVGAFYARDFEMFGYRNDMPAEVLASGRVRFVSPDEDRAARAEWPALPPAPAPRAGRPGARARDALRTLGASLGLRPK